MTDVERVLEALLHDLRTPIGVAQGYLRLMQEGHLTDGADRERAVSNALRALGQTARLCRDATDFLNASAPVTNLTRVSAASFAGQVEACARQQGLTVASGAIGADAMLRVADNVDDVCEAIITVVCSPKGRGGSKHASSTLHMRANGDQLRFRSAAADAQPDLDSPHTAPFDGYWAHGLGVAAACRRIARSSGHVLAVEPGVAGAALMVAFPLENQPL